MRTLLLRGASTVAFAFCISQFHTAAEAADAATPGTSATTIGELVVTSEKRAQNLETVPVSVSAFTAKDRDLKGIASVQDLSDFTPGLAYSTFDNRPYIRGIGRQSDNLAVESGVAVYADGIFNGANASTVLQPDSLFVDQIEVLRGPQSTLYGRNADGGAINYISKKPTNDFEAEVRAGAANYDKYFIEGAMSGPITDWLRFRIGGNYTSQTGGYYHNLDGPPEGGSVAQGGNGDSYHIELQFDGHIGDRFDWWAKVASSDYKVTYHTETQIGPLDTREFYDPLMPNQNFGLCALPGGAGNAGCAGNPDTLVGVTTLPNTVAGNPSAINPRTFDADFKSDANQDRDISLATTMTYHFDGVDVKYLFGYQKFHYNLSAPWLFSQGISSGVESYTLKGPATATGLCSAIFNNAGCTQNLTVNPANTQFTFDEYEEFYSHELNFSSTGHGPVQWIAGLYWYHEDYDQPINVLDPSQPQVRSPLNLITNPFTPAASNPTGSVYNEYTALKENSYAAFGQVDWKITDTLKLTGGLRYTDDRKDGQEQFRLVLFNFEGAGLGVNTFGANTPAFDATSCPAGPYPGAGACTVDPATGKAIRGLDATWHAVTGTAGLSWTPDPDTLAYLKYSRGYKTGGFNSGIVAPFPETVPETVDAYEAGAKKTFGHTFQANLAAFYYDYFNDQQPLGVVSNDVVTTEIINLPVVHTYGVELETLWQPIANLTLNLNYAYLHATIANGGACVEDTADPMALAPGANISGCAAAPANQTQSLKGNTVPESPRNKVSLNALYTMKFQPGNLTLSGTFIWKDSEYNSPFNRYYNESPAYTQVNGRLTWTGEGNRYSVIVFADNIFNTTGYDGTTGILVTNPGVSQVIDRLASLTAPRTFGVEVQYRFK